MLEKECVCPIKKRISKFHPTLKKKKIKNTLQTTNTGQRHENSILTIF
jgi:hypothetical protein